MNVIKNRDKTEVKGLSGRDRVPIRMVGKCGFVFRFKFDGKVLCSFPENKLGTDVRYSF